MQTKTYNKLKSLELLNLNFSQCLQEASLRGFPYFERTICTFCTDLNNEPQSVILYRKVCDDLIEIDFIAVLKSSRGRGFAKALINNLEGRVWLEVHEKNQAARDFYSSCGFKKVGERKAYYGDSSAVLMEKRP